MTDTPMNSPVEVHDELDVKVEQGTSMPWLAVYKRELGLYFRSPIAYGVAFAILFFLGILFNSYIAQAISANASGHQQIAADATYPCSWSNRGRVKRFKGDIDGAIADYSKAIDLDPNFAIALNNRGDAYIQTGDLDKAVADLDKAISAEPDFPRALGNRGYAKYLMHDYDGAIVDYTAEIALTPNDVLAFINRGTACAVCASTNAHSSPANRRYAAVNFGRMSQSTVMRACFIAPAL